MTVYEPDPEALKKLLSLSYEEFCNARLVLKIFSEILETEIYLVSHPSLAEHAEGDVYTPDEILGLAKIRDTLKPHYDERLRKIHHAKKIFEGKILDKGH